MHIISCYFLNKYYSYFWIKTKNIFHEMYTYVFWIWGLWDYIYRHQVMLQYNRIYYYNSHYCCCRPTQSASKESSYKRQPHDDLNNLLMLFVLNSGVDYLTINLILLYGCWLRGVLHVCHWSFSRTSSCKILVYIHRSLSVFFYEFVCLVNLHDYHIIDRIS